MCRHGSDHGLPWEDYGLKSDSKECFNNKLDGKFPHCQKYTATELPKCQKCHWGWILNHDNAATAANVCLAVPTTQTHFHSSCLKASLITGTTNLKCMECLDSTFMLNNAGTEC